MEQTQDEEFDEAAMTLHKRILKSGMRRKRAVAIRFKTVGASPVIEYHCLCGSSHEEHTRRPSPAGAVAEFVSTHSRCAFDAVRNHLDSAGVDTRHLERDLLRDGADVVANRLRATLASATRGALRRDKPEPSRRREASDTSDAPTNYDATMALWSRIDAIEIVLATLNRRLESVEFRVSHPLERTRPNGEPKKENDSE